MKRHTRSIPASIWKAFRPCRSTACVMRSILSCPRCRARRTWKQKRWIDSSILAEVTKGMPW